MSRQFEILSIFVGVLNADNTSALLSWDPLIHLGGSLQLWELSFNFDTMIKKQQIIRFFQRVMRWLRYWLWKRPVSKPEPLTAKEVVENWVIIRCMGQRIALHKHEIPMWSAMSRKDKRRMALKTKAQEERGEIKFVEIDGKTTCVRNLDYDRRAEKKKQAEHGIS